ncbi:MULTISPECIES: UDP-N-acetylglucosamine--undecaprenyl-phosphate N-acetylglucosaminephosphotransferase [Pseudoalteromonas]|uniref:Undecaprenyl-phosphate alpha-N-acetylglucosaminyl 1-phosphate transferase n=1 Tax=Pseudoalteromonas obscura TaxID=3048491 RepID=A0ABT7ER97_9GAMM|nr:MULTISPECIES: UDP-N-acetylglucosamine--undecaprenyl-phosphate N-acetylglucosaminephosphotransferase [Pseudoalteromonas]MBQ4838265.1 UDP-N-acetylglucosamine--undecaprenyl-phosphate N-acetylglucosaminephosphotransferase [Pseudoalteromonas luteoviolacea]MDK2597576.1 UDP-N-acetylglucosamine--undecaprenyl-phosphate N-acetylglucosaminephosphotransferase [Pseudoalteromonas sp. P94(2023)]
MVYFLPFITSFVACVLAVYLVYPLSIKYGLVDSPCARKQHKGEIPLVGGIAIYIAILLSSLLFFRDDLLIVYVISSTAILIVGVLDDRFELSVKSRILIQVIAALFLISQSGLYIDSFGYILGNDFELYLGKFGVVVTVIAVVGAINAFNMVDGIDGLAGMLSLVSFTCLGFLYYYTGSQWAILPTVFMAAILAFLMYNLRWPSRSVHKIFMGDAGSMLIGFTVVWLLIVGVDTKGDAEAILKPVTALYLIAVPFMDMVAIMYRRVKKGKSPFKPDREHLHHIFERIGFSRKRSLLYISLIAIVIAIAGCLMQVLGVPEWVMFSIFLSLFLIYNFALMHVWKITTWVRKHRDKRLSKR